MCFFGIFQDTWDDLQKYIKRNVKQTLDEKIAKRRAQVQVNGNADVDTDSEMEGIFISTLCGHKK